MSARYYHFCQRHKGRPVSIRTRDGRTYRGIIGHVTQSHVHLRPMGRGISEGNSEARQAQSAEETAIKQEGEEIFFFFPIIPLAAIAGITLIGLGGWGWGGYGWW